MIIPSTPHLARRRSYSSLLSLSGKRDALSESHPAVVQGNGTGKKSDQLSAVIYQPVSRLIPHGTWLIPSPSFIRIHLRPRSYPARRLFSPAAPSATHWPDLSPVSWLANFRHSFRQSNIAAIDRIACSRTCATIPPIHAGHFCPTAPRRPRRTPTDYDTSGTWIRYWVRCTRAWTTGTSEGHWSAREPISSVS